MSVVAPSARRERSWDLATAVVALVAMVAVVVSAVVFVTASPRAAVGPSIHDAPAVIDRDAYDVLCFKPRFRAHPVCTRSGQVGGTVPSGTLP